MHTLLISIIILLFFDILFTLMSYMVGMNIYNTLHDIIKGTMKL